MKAKFSLGLVATAALMLSGCADEQVQVTETVQTVAALQLQAPEKLQVRRVNGQAAVADLTRVAFRVNGTIAGLQVLPGQKVQEGQLLARLEDDILRQKLQDAKAQYELIQKQWQRAEKVLSQGLLAQADFDELNANLRLAKVQLKAAQTNLSYAQLRAPFDGVVDTLSKQAFETTAVGETVLTIYRQDRIDVEIQVPDTMMSHTSGYNPNQDYHPLVTWQDNEQGVPAQYLEHSLSLMPETGSYIAKMSLPSEHVNLLPGQAVQLEIDLKQAGLPASSGFRVPLTALQAGDGEQFTLWHIVGDQVAPVSVSVIRMSQDGALVMGPLKAGERVVTSGLSRLRDGQRVAWSE